MFLARFALRARLLFGRRRGTRFLPRRRRPRLRSRTRLRSRMRFRLRSSWRMRSRSRFRLRSRFRSHRLWRRTGFRSSWCRTRFRSSRCGTRLRASGWLRRARRGSRRRTSRRRPRFRRRSRFWNRPPRLRTRSRPWRGAWRSHRCRVTRFRTRRWRGMEILSPRSRSRAPIVHRTRLGYGLWPAVILIRKLRPIPHRLLRIRALCGQRSDVPLIAGRILRRGGPIIQSTMAAVKAHPGVGDIRHVVVVNVVNHGLVHVRDGGVVVEGVAAPVAAFVAVAVVAEPVMDSAIEAYVRAPVAVIPVIPAFVEAPVAGRPQCPDVWRQDPRPRNPVVACRRVRPVARRPDVIVPRARRLIVVGQIRRRIRCGIVRRVRVPGFARILIRVLILRRSCLAARALIRRRRRRVLVAGRRRHVAGVGQICRRRVVTAHRLRCVLIAVAARQRECQKQK